MSGIIEKMQAEIESLKWQVAELNAIIGKQTVDNRGVVLKSPQQRRDEIVEQAKRDVEYWEYEMPMRYRYNYVNFVVNKEKRTVVALLKVLAGSKAAKRGIAKCAPNDCFNSHIGKAIALRRALGLPVPDEYLNAPQPTEVRVGDIVDWGWKKLSYKIADGYRVICLNNGEDMTEYAEIKYAKIIDDSRDDCE